MNVPLFNKKRSSAAVAAAVAERQRRERGRLRVSNLTSQRTVSQDTFLYTMYFAFLTLLRRKLHLVQRKAARGAF
jgi:hypothetical protein